MPDRLEGWTFGWADQPQLPAVAEPYGVRPRLPPRSGAAPGSPWSQVLVEGHGPAVAAGDIPGVRYLAADWATGEVLHDSWTAGVDVEPVPRHFPEIGLYDFLPGLRVGSRIEAVLPVWPDRAVFYVVDVVDVLEHAPDAAPRMPPPAVRSPSVPDGSIVTVHAAYYQYYVQDDGVGCETEGHERYGDGVLAPLGTGVVVTTGVNHGPVQVELHFTEPTEEVRPDEVAAECDLELPSGVLRLGWAERDAAHDFGSPQQLRVRAVVENRITTHEAGYTGERHRLWIWPSASPRPRWRSGAIDHIGSELAQVTDHVR